MILLKPAVDGPTSTFSSDQWCKIKKSSSIALNDVEVCLLRLNTSSSAFCIGLPDLPNKVEAQFKIKELDLWATGLTLSPHKKGLPKLTVSQISLEVLEMECESSLSITDRDDMTSKTLISLILEKSANLREFSCLKCLSWDVLWK